MCLLSYVSGASRKKTSLMIKRTYRNGNDNPAKKGDRMQVKARFGRCTVFAVESNSTKKTFAVVLFNHMWRWSEMTAEEIEEYWKEKEAALTRTQRLWNKLYYGSETGRRP